MTAEGFTGQSRNSLNIFTGEGKFLDRKEHSFNRGNTLNGGELFLLLNAFFLTDAILKIDWFFFSMFEKQQVGDRFAFSF